MLNRIFKFSTLIALALVFVLTSCDKENLDELTTENFTEQAESRQQGPKGERGGKGGKGEKGGKCFSTVFPITLSFPDGSTAEVADRTAAKEALEAWKTANPDSEERPAIAFPYDVTLADETVVTITDEAALAALKETCGDRGGKGNRGEKGQKCFTVIYPLTINFPDGSTAEVADKAAAKEAKRAWKEANPESEERPSIAMPFDVMLKDSSTVTITNEEDLTALKETCGDRGGRGGKGGKGQRCFKLVYPLTLSFPDGTTAEVEDKAAAKAAKRAWKEANPDSEERPSIAYPYDVELADETTATVTSDEDMAALKESCNSDDEDNN